MTRRSSSTASLAALLLAATLPAAAGDFSPAKVSKGDWAKYLVSVDNKTQAFLSQKEKPRWRVVSATGVGRDNQIARIEGITTSGGKKVSTGGTSFLEMDRPYEPLFFSSQVPFVIASTTSEAVTLKNKTYACKKIVRRLDQAEDMANGRVEWKGTSTIWLSGDVPLGLVKMVNDYETSMGSPMKLVETWVLDEAGFKNWKVE